MENTGRFAKSFIGKVVASGTKTSGSVNPTLTLASTKDKFVLNKKAMGILGVQEGDSVVLIDMNANEVVEQDCNQRWFIAKGWDKGNGNTEGAKIGKGGSFSYSTTYSAMVINQPDVPGATVADMVAAGKGITRESEKTEKSSFIGLQKVQFNLQRLVDESGADKFELAKDVFQEVFVLTNRTEIAHDPKRIDSDDDSEE